MRDIENIIGQHAENRAFFAAAESKAVNMSACKAVIAKSCREAVETVIRDNKIDLMLMNIDPAPGIERTCNTVSRSESGCCVEGEETTAGQAGCNLQSGDLKIREERIIELLREKEILLKEVHHRIKNNMYTLESMLTLQCDSLRDTGAAEAIQDAVSRVHSMGLLYDKLYRSSNINEASAREYFSTLVDEITAMFANSDRVKIEKNIENFMLNAKILFPLGIFMNEILTNSMKHAFGDRKDGRIDISVTKKGGRASVAISDNGVGIPETINLKDPKGFGLTLINLLVLQISGDFRIERSGGTRCILEFDIAGAL